MMVKIRLNRVLNGRCPVCHFEKLHLVSCQLGQSEAEVDHYKALAERRGEALMGLLRDMHTGTSVQRGSFGPEGIGCGRPCPTCSTARAAIAAKPEEAREKERW
ncbi:hypothetical protein LCGC14_1324320 [marine sediment metagenome]|uniref:Uncharacterized protein n=1 Tax=marine sediment metagenome TaxID=412755 RepID=A0A0F9MZE4_9ZZZZ